MSDNDIRTLVNHIGKLNKELLRYKSMEFNFKDNTKLADKIKTEELPFNYDVEKEQYYSRISDNKM